MSITSERIRENCFIHHLMDAAADDIEALEQELATITKQRDLAVEALTKTLAALRMPCDRWSKIQSEIVSKAVKVAELTLSTIKESEEN